MITPQEQGIGEAPSLFTRMLRGKVAAHFILRSERLRVAAIMDTKPAHLERCAQVVVFPYEQGRFTPTSRVAVGFAVGAIGTRMMDSLRPGLIVEHKEGYGVREHDHVVMFPSYGRGDSDALHHRDESETADPEQLAELAAVLRFSESDTRKFEEDAMSSVQDFLTLATMLGPDSVFLESVVR